MASNRPSAKMLEYQRLCEVLCQKELENAEIKRSYNNQLRLLQTLQQAHKETIDAQKEMIEMDQAMRAVDEEAIKMIEKLEKQSEMEAVWKEIEEVRAENRDVCAQIELLEAELQQKQADIATMPDLIREINAHKLKVEQMKIKNANMDLVNVKQEPIGASPEEPEESAPKPKQKQKSSPSSSSDSDVDDLTDFLNSYFTPSPEKTPNKVSPTMSPSKIEHSE